MRERIVEYVNLASEEISKVRGVLERPNP